MPRIRIKNFVDYDDDDDDDYQPRRRCREPEPSQQPKSSLMIIPMPFLVAIGVFILYPVFIGSNRYVVAPSGQPIIVNNNN